ncbi:MAG: response regulator transcription factor [Anaerolineae bacterium]|jgi:DNA-binding NarL/FixJ family response regulator|nr:response regulator transcription factor [Anaerolineae bacterium]
MAESIRVLLADDHPALRVGLKVLLDHAPDIDVVGEADDGEAALALITALQPDVVVLDCQLPALDGVAVLAHLQAQRVPVRVLALSAYDDDRYLAGMAEAGAVGYLLKNEAPGRIVEAVRAASQGALFWTAEQQARIRRWREEVARRQESLTARECEVLRLIVDGLSNKEIAQALFITVRTADFHVSNILRKLGAVSRVEAAVWARSNLPDVS